MMNGHWKMRKWTRKSGLLINVHGASQLVTFRSKSGIKRSIQVIMRSVEHQFNHEIMYESLAGCRCGDQLPRITLSRAALSFPDYRFLMKKVTTWRKYRLTTLISRSIKRFRKREVNICLVYYIPDSAVIMVLRYLQKYFGSKICLKPNKIDKALVPRMKSLIFILPRYSVSTA